MSCLTADLLARLEAGLLDARSGADAFAHLGACARCQDFHKELFATLKTARELPDEVVRATPRADSWEKIRGRLGTVTPEAPVEVKVACTYCKDRLLRKESVYCAGCLAPHHGACWQEHGRCAACAVASLVRPVSERAPRTGSSGNVPRIVVVGLAVSLAAGVAALAERRSSASAREGLKMRAEGAAASAARRAEESARSPSSELAHVLLQVRSGAGGGNPNRIDMLGATSSHVSERVTSPIPFNLDIDVNERSRAYAQPRVVPRGKVFVVTKVKVRAIAKGDSNGHGEFVVRLGNEAIFQRRDVPLLFEDTWEGRRVVRPGEEESVNIEVANSSHCEAEFWGTLEGPGAPVLVAKTMSIAEVDSFIASQEPRNEKAEFCLDLVRTLLEKREFARARQVAEIARGIASRDGWTESLAILEDLAARLGLPWHPEHLAGLIGQDPNAWAARLGLVKFLIPEEPAKAIAHLDFCIAHPELADDRLAQAHVLRSRARRIVGDIAGAHADLDRAIALEGNDASDIVLEKVVFLIERRDAAGALAAAEACDRAGSDQLSRQALAYAREASFEDAAPDALAAWWRSVDGNDAVEIGPRSILAARAERTFVLEEFSRKNPRATLGDLVALLGAERARRAEVARRVDDDRDVPGSSMAHARLLLSQGDAAEAKKVCEDVPRREWEKAERDVVLGRIALVEKNVPRAIACFEAALARVQTCTAAISGLALAYRERQAEAEARSLGAKARLLEANDQGDELSWNFQRGVALAREAARFLDEEKAVRASRAFARVVTRNPLHARARLERAKLAAAFRMWDVAAAEIDEALALDPWFQEAQLEKARLHATLLPRQASPETHRPRSLAHEPAETSAWIAAIELARSEDERLSLAEEWLATGSAPFAAAEAWIDRIVGSEWLRAGKARTPAEAARALAALLSAMAHNGVRDDDARRRDIRRADAAKAFSRLRASVREEVLELLNRAHAARTGLTARPQEALELAERACSYGLVARDPWHLDVTAGQAHFERGLALLELGHPVAAARALVLGASVREKSVEGWLALLEDARALGTKHPELEERLSALAATHPDELELLELRLLLRAARGVRDGDSTRWGVDALVAWSDATKAGAPQQSAQLLALSRPRSTRPADAYFKARALLALDRKDELFVRLEHSPQLREVVVSDTAFAALRDDERFQKLFQKMRAKPRILVVGRGDSWSSDWTEKKLARWIDPETEVTVAHASTFLELRFVDVGTFGDPRTPADESYDVVVLLGAPSGVLGKPRVARALETASSVVVVAPYDKLAELGDTSFFPLRTKGARRSTSSRWHALPGLDESGVRPIFDGISFVDAVAAAPAGEEVRAGAVVLARHTDGHAVVVRSDQDGKRVLWLDSFHEGVEALDALVEAVTRP